MASRPAELLIDPDERRPEHIFQCAGKQDDQTLDYHDHIAGNVRHLEGKISSALIQDTEQDGRTRCVAVPARATDLEEYRAAAH